LSEITVATLNLFNRMGDWDRRAPLVIDEMERLMPDIITFQEVDLMLDQGMWISRRINLRLPQRPHYRIKHAASPGPRVSIHGIAILARLPFLEHEVLDLMTFDRIAQRTVFALADRRFALVNLHLHHPAEAVEERAQQVEYLMSWLDRDGRRLPTIVAGDFNAYAQPPEKTVRLMKERFRSAYEVVHGREPERTWPTPVNTFDSSPPGTLDYIFVSEEFHVLDAGLAFDRPAKDDGSLFPSDHLGVYARLGL
jgi:endonuclease/exonuclease/phosphatase family metal-dependent hydrolase